MPFADKACAEPPEWGVRTTRFGSRSNTICFPMRRTAAIRVRSKVDAISRAGDFSGSGFCPSHTDSITSPVTRFASPRAIVSTSGSSGTFLSVQKPSRSRQAGSYWEINVMQEGTALLRRVWTTTQASL